MAILDAWTSLYGTGVDAREDTLTAWMRVVSMCAPRSRGGQALLLGETDPVIARSLALWDGRVPGCAELAERAETGLPPVVGAACVWGRRDVVRAALEHIGVFTGDLAVIDTGKGVCRRYGGPCRSHSRARSTPASLRPRRTGLRRWCGCRCPNAPNWRDGCVRRVARHVAAREPGELRFQLDPKDLI